MGYLIGRVEAPNARVLGYSQNTEGFGGDFRFKNRKTVEIEGLLLDLRNFDGVSGITSGVQALQNSINQEYQNVIINDLDLGRGRVIGFSVPEDIHVQTATYSLSFEIDETGNLFNLSGEFYEDLDFMRDQGETGRMLGLHLLDSFREDFDFQRGANDYGYTRNISIQYKSGDNTIITPVERAKVLAQYLLNNNTPFGFIDAQVSGFHSNPYRRQYSETFDEINNNCRFSEDFKATNLSGSYSIDIEHSIQTATDGITSIDETCNIKALFEPRRDIVQQAVQLEIGGAYERCSGVFEFYKPSNSYPLNATPLTRGRSINAFEGTATINANFNNNPAHNETFFWQYTLTLDKNGSFYNISEKGDVQGYGRPILERHENALNAYSNVKTGVLERVSGLYAERISANPIFLESQTESRSQYNGTVDYEFQYTDNPSYGESGVRSFDLNISDDLPIQMVNVFNVFNQKQLVQKAQTTVLGSRSINLSLLGKRESSLGQLLGIAKEKMNNHKPSGETVYISDVSYTFEPLEKTLDLNASWTYNQALSGLTGFLL